MKKITELEQVRRDKLEAMAKENIQGYARDVTFTHTSKKLEEEFSSFSKDELHEKAEVVSVVARVMSTRGPFVIGKDVTGPIQAYIPKDNDEVKKVMKYVDLGDILRFEGEVMKTNTGTLTIRASKVQIVTKALRPLPEKFHGLKDVEERYRRRYVDLIVNEESKNIFLMRAKIMKTIRNYFDELGYMEAETPILQPILGGAAAKPFTTHHNALDMQFYLRIATELPLKRLLVGGIERVYEIGRLFRNEGIDTTHNPEFTTIEFYEAYSNLEGMMERTERLIHNLAKELDKEIVTMHSNKINLIKPFKRINMVEAVEKAIGKNIKDASLEEAKEIAKEHNIKVESYFSVGHIINELFEELIEETLIQPTFVYGHPIEISPLAAKNTKDERFTDRAELFIGGKEYANMFTELNDPIDQLERFKAQLREKEAGNDEASEIDYDYVEALEQGMPPAGGCGIGIDRLTMLLTEKESIREVLLFPHLKEKGNKNNE